MSQLKAWDRTGHLCDDALVALADGQHAIVDEDARAHAETCDVCAAKLAELALESVAVGEALAHVAGTERAAARFPTVAVSVAVVLGLVGALPTLLEGRWSATVLGAPHWLATFGAALVSAFRTFHSSPFGTAAAFAAAVLLVVSGALVARQQRAIGASSFSTVLSGLDQAHTDRSTPS